MTPFPGEIKRSQEGGCSYVLTDEQAEWFTHWFPIVENSRIAKAMHISLPTMHRLKRKLMLKKSAAGMKAIKRRQAKAVAKICEANGHYASMRGKRPSEASIAGLKKRWDDIKAGRRDHPLVAMRKKSPKRYAKLMQQKSDRFKELFRKERLRVKYGMKQLTNMKNTALYPYTKSQSNHRYSALNRGYLLAEDCSEGSPGRYVIFYDKDTQRSEQFEQNCKNDGFRIEPL